MRPYQLMRLAVRVASKLLRRMPPCLEVLEGNVFIVIGDADAILLAVIVSHKTLLPSFCSTIPVAVEAEKEFEEE